MNKQQLLQFVLDLRAGRGESDDAMADMIYEIAMAVSKSLDVGFDQDLMEMVMNYILDAKRDEIAVKLINGLLSPSPMGR